MANLNQFLGGGGGVFVPSFISSVQIVPSGAMGTLFTLSPPPGHRVMLSRLGPAEIARLSGCTLSGSVEGDILTGTLEYSPNYSGEFGIGISGGNEHTTSLPPVIFGVDEIVTFSKEDTAHFRINYQYAFGSIK